MKSAWRSQVESEWVRRGGAGRRSGDGGVLSNSEEEEELVQEEVNRSLAEAPNQVRLVRLELGETQVEELENPNTGGDRNYGIATMLKAELPMLRVIHQKQQLQLRGVVSPVFHPGGGEKKAGGVGGAVKVCILSTLKSCIIQWVLSRCVSNSERRL